MGYVFSQNDPHTGMHALGKVGLQKKGKIMFANCHLQSPFVPPAICPCSRSPARSLARSLARPSSDWLLARHYSRACLIACSFARLPTRPPVRPRDRPLARLLAHPPFPQPFAFSHTRAFSCALACSLWPLWPARLLALRPTIARTPASPSRTPGNQSLYGNP